MPADDTCRFAVMKLAAGCARLIVWSNTMDDGDGGQRRSGRSIARRAMRLAAWWCAGATVAAAIAIALALFHRPSFETTQGRAVIGDDSYLVTIESATAVKRIVQMSERDQGWSPRRATGPP